MEHTITSEQVGAYTVYAYTDKSFFVTGDTKAIKEQLKQLNGRFSKLPVGPAQSYVPGWLFSNRRKEAVVEFLLTGALEPTKPPSPAAAPSSSVVAPVVVPPLISALTSNPVLFEAVNKFFNVLNANQSSSQKIYKHQMTPDLIEILILGQVEAADRMLDDYYADHDNAQLQMRVEMGDMLLLVLLEPGHL